MHLRGEEMLSARAHTTLRLLAVLVIALAALVPHRHASGLAGVASPVAKSTVSGQTTQAAPVTQAGLRPSISPSIARR